MAILYSDTAIIIYELVAILILILLIRKFSSKKKEIKEQEMERLKKSRERSLERQLYNDRRRQG